MADLAAAGRSNREIADQLVISVRTVESHLASAYRKLDVRSRVQLAPVLARIAVESPANRLTPLPAQGSVVPRMRRGEELP